MKLTLLNRTPPSSQIMAIYGLIVMLIYGWSLYWFIWNLPSWLGFLTPVEIWAMLAYTLSVNLFESLTFLVVILGFCIVLPPQWMRDDFIWRSSSIILLCLIYLMATLAQSTPLSSTPKYALFSLIIFIVTQFISTKTRVLRNFMNEFTDRSIIFAYITIPLSIVCLIYVLIRNI